MDFDFKSFSNDVFYHSSKIQYQYVQRQILHYYESKIAFQSRFNHSYQFLIRKSQFDQSTTLQNRQRSKQLTLYSIISENLIFIDANTLA